MRFTDERHSKRYQGTLDDLGLTTQSGIEDLLLQLTDTRRLERGRMIKDRDVSIQKLSQNALKASIKEYQVELKFRDKVLKHDCDDWRKGLRNKRICKHIAKMFLSITHEDSKRILQNLLDEKARWRFELI
jgi:hypothetical protein